MQATVKECCRGGCGGAGYLLLANTESALPFRIVAPPGIVGCVVCPRGQRVLRLLYAGMDRERLRGALTGAEVDARLAAWEREQVETWAQARGAARFIRPDGSPLLPAAASSRIKTR